MPHVLALDQGTTSSRAIVFDESGAAVAVAQRELRQIFPRPGWVEHDPLEIWESQLAVAREALARAGTPFHQAHQIVGRFVLESVRAGKKPSDWTAQEMQKFTPEFTPDFAALLNPAEGMKSREIPGGTGANAVATALARARQLLGKLIV